MEPSSPSSSRLIVSANGMQQQKGARSSYKKVLAFGRLLMGGACVLAILRNLRTPFRRDDFMYATTTMRTTTTTATITTTSSTKVKLIGGVEDYNVKRELTLEGSNNNTGNHVIDNHHVGALYHLPANATPPTPSPTVDADTAKTAPLAAVTQRASGHEGHQEQETSVIVPPPPKQVSSPTTAEPPTTKQVTSPLTASKHESSPSTAIEPPSEKHFSACLYWMDDYSRLIEWLAYHYQVLPLRALVISIDPKSRLDPTPVLDRWKSRIDIKVWKRFEDFMAPDHLKAMNRTDRSTTWKHRYNQIEFVRNCSMYHKSQNRTWTMHSDTDEYLVIKSNKVQNASERMKEHGVTWDLIQEAHANPQPNARHVNRLEWDCITLTRRVFTSFENPKAVTESSSYSYFDGFDPFRFQTLRYRYSSKNAIGKSLVDVSKYNWATRGHSEISVHKTLKECVHQWGSEGDWMLFNHYRSSWEQYKRPADNRGGEARLLAWYRLNAGDQRRMTDRYGHEAVPWLEGFVRHVGKDEARYLLADVGHPYNPDTALQPTDNITMLVEARLGQPLEVVA